MPYNHHTIRFAVVGNALEDAPCTAPIVTQFFFRHTIRFAVVGNDLEDTSCRIYSNFFSLISHSPTIIKK